MRVRELLLMFICGGLMLTSCSKFYYSNINSVQRDIFRNEMGDFVQDDDMVSIIYSFYGQDLPIQITVHNKTDEPLLVDWSQSALIVEDEATNYVKGDVRIRGNITGRTYTYRDYLFSGTSYSNNYGHFDGNMKVPENTSFIPPRSRITHTPITLANFTFEDIPDNVYRKVPFVGNTGNNKKVKVVDFKEYDSPLRFRSYLTLYSIGPNGEREDSFAYEQRFYLARVIKAGAMTPENMNEYTNKRGDFFFVRNDKARNAGIITGIIAIGVAGVVLDVTTGTNFYYY